MVHISDELFGKMERLLAQLAKERSEGPGGSCPTINATAAKDILDGLKKEKEISSPVLNE